MSKLPLVHSRDVIAALEKVGFRHVRTRGSHHVLVSDNPSITITVPEHREVPRGTLRSILRQAGIAPEQFLDLLSDR